MSLREDYDPKTLNETLTSVAIQEENLNIDEFSDELKAKMQELKETFDQYIADPSEENLEELSIIDIEVAEMIADLVEADAPDRTEEEYMESPIGKQERLKKLAIQNDRWLTIEQIRTVIPDCPLNTILTIGDMQLEKSIYKTNTYRVYFN